METCIKMAKCTPGTVKSKWKGRAREVAFQVEIPDADQFGDELDKVSGQTGQIEFHDPDTGELLTTLLGYVETVDLRVPRKDPPYLILALKASLKHCSPAQLRRLANKPAAMTMHILEERMRQRAIAEAEGKVLPAELQ